MADALDNFLAARGSAAPAPPPADSAFSKGLRAGVSGVAADLHGLAGQAGEGVGRFFGKYGHNGVRDAAAGFAAEQRAAAVAAEEEGARAYEGVPQTFGDVHSAGELWDYGSGLVGKSVPAIGAGLAGGAAAALAAPELAGASLLGATAATAPMTIGAQYNAQQADPVQAAQPYGLRSGLGAGVGAGQAVLMNAMPQLMVGKLFGKAAATAQPFGKALASNLGEAVAGNAAASVASTAAGQQAANTLNPQRDTGGDLGELGESAVSGGVVGLPFVPFGTLGSMRGPRPAGANPGRSVVARIRDAASAGVDKAKGAFGRDAPVDLNAERTGGITDVTPNVPLGERVQGAADAVKGAAKSGVDAVRGIFAAKADPAAQAAKDIAAGDTDGLKTIDPEAYATASPEAQAAMAEAAKKNRVDQVVQMAKELYNDKTLSPESKAALDAMGGDFTSAASAMKVAGIALYQKAAKAGGDAINGLSEWVNAQRAKDGDEGGDGLATMSEAEYKKAQAENGGAPRLKSEFSPEITAVIKDTVTPFLQQHNPNLLANPDALNKLAESLRYMMTYMTDRETGMLAGDEARPLPEHVAGHLQNVFGGAASRVLHALTNALGPGDHALLKEVNALGRAESLGASRTAKLAEMLGPELVNRHGLTRPELGQIAKAIAAHVDGSAYRHLGRDERDYQSRAFEDLMAERFGNKTNRILAAFAKDEQHNKRASRTGDDRAPGEDGDGLTSDEDHTDLSSDDLFHNDMMDEDGALTAPGGRIESGLERTGAHGDQLVDQYDTPTYHGEGPTNRMVRTTDAWRARAERMGYDLNKPAPVDALRKQLENGPGRDRNVSFVPFRKLPADLRAAHFERIRASTEEGMATKGIDREAAEAEALAKHGDPNEIGLFRIEGMKQEGRLTPEDMEYLTVDTGKTSHKEDPTRILTGKRGASVDAMRVVKLFNGKDYKGDDRVPYNRTDDQGAKYRLAHVFMEGIAAVQDHLGEGFEIPDSTVLRKGFMSRDSNGNEVFVPPVTWGGLRGKVLTDTQKALLEQHPAGTEKGDKLRQIFGGRGDAGISMMPHDAGKESTEFTTFLREADNDELNKAAKARQKVVGAHELAIADRLEAAREEWNAQYAGLSKNDRYRKIRALTDALRKQLATPESTAAELELFRIEKEREGRGADNLVAAVDAPTRTLARRFDDKMSEEIARYKKYYLKLEDGATPTREQEAKIRTRMRELADEYRLGGLHYDDARAAGGGTGEPVRLAQGETTDEQVALMRQRGRVTDQRMTGEPVMREVDPAGQVHIARAGAGAFKEEPFNGPREAGLAALYDPARPTSLSKAEQELVVKKDLAGEPISHKYPPRDREGAVYRNGQRLDEVILKLETAKGVGAKELGRKARALDDYFDSVLADYFERRRTEKEPPLTPEQEEVKLLQKRFHGRLIAAERMSDVAPLINEQYARFAEQIAKVPGAGEPGGGGLPTSSPRAAGEGVVLKESPASGYRERTQHNANSAGATVAIAANFTTAGERLTKSVAGDKYFSIAYGSTAKKAGAALAEFMKGKNTSTLNIAGNGIYTLSGEKGLTQPEVNAYIHAIIAATHAIHPITKIVSGGQTGVDIAGAVAAKALGIPAEITLPKGFKQRGVDGVDRTYSKQAIEKQIADGAMALTEKQPGQDQAAEEAAGSQWKGSKPKKTDAFVQQALAGGAATDKVVTRVQASTDAPGMARALKDLLAHPESNEHGERVVQAMNARIGELAHDDPATAYNLLRKDDGSAVSTLRQMIGEADVGKLLRTIEMGEDGQTAQTHYGVETERMGRVYLDKVIGPQIGLWHSTEALNRKGIGAAYSRAVAPDGSFERILMPNGRDVSRQEYRAILYHESAHALFARLLSDPAFTESTERLVRVASSDHILNQLDAIFQETKHPLDAERYSRYYRANPEEAVAYMYQHWATGDLKITDKPVLTVFEKIKAWLHQFLAGLSDEQHADLLFRMFKDGALKEALPKADADSLNAAYDTSKARGYINYSDGSVYSLMSARVHEELERPGFAATHDSPIKHEGSFDWRKNTGKGEGNAAFGAGTYLSTAEGVHRSYKNDFTEQAGLGSRTWTLGNHRGEYTVINDEVLDNEHYIVDNRLNRAQKAVLEHIANEGGDAAAAVEAIRRDYLNLAEKRGRDLLEHANDDGELAPVERYLAAGTKIPPDAATPQVHKLMNVDRWNSQIDHSAETLRDLAAIDPRSVSVGLPPKSPTYHVSVDIPHEQLLNWNTPLSEQSVFVRRALRGEPMEREFKWSKSLGFYHANVRGHLFHIEPADDGKFHLSENAPTAANLGNFDPRGVYHTLNDAVAAAKERAAGADPIGQQIYTGIASRLGSDRAASEHLQSLGILGHRYASHDGTDAAYPNYVIYDDSKIHTNYTELSQQRARNPNASTISSQADVKAHLEKVLGPAVDVQFANLLHAGDYRRGKDAAGKATDFIRLSLHSLDPMSTAFHESLHGFIAHMVEMDQHGVNAALYKAANSFVMRGKLRKLLANEPDALKQIENSTEERAAYMYQFYHTRDPVTGKRLLELNDAPRNVIEKIAAFIKGVLGIWSTDQRAVHIMDYLHSGEYAAKGMGDRNAVQRVLLERGTNKTFEVVKKTLAPLTKIANHVISGGDAALADLHNPAIDKIRTLIFSHGTGQDRDPGWIVAHRTERTAVLNGLMGEFAKRDTTAEQLQQALGQLQSGVKAATPEARLLAHKSGPIRQMLDRMYDYMRDAGVKVRDLGYGDDYFPVVYDTSYIAANQKAWRAMLDKYVRRGDLSGQAADEFTATLLANDGNLFGATDRPGMQHTKERKLDFIDPQDRAPFQQKDLITTMNSYVTQAARRAEWARRFGDKNERLNALRLEAVAKHGATKADMRQLEDYIQGVNGTLGDDISPTLRRLFGNAIVYQNVRLLPLAVFSMAVDPMLIVVRGGTVRDAFNAFKRGIQEIPRGFQKNPKADPWYDLSKVMGTIDDTALVHTLGSSFSQGMVGDTGRRMNDMYFKFNLVEQMNTSMRVAALPAALAFIARHADGTGQHSTRYLAELGLKPDEVVMNSGKNALTIGPADARRPLLTKQEFLDHGMNDAQATRAALRMRAAVNKWVDGAVLRPNSAQKPVWFNDPHFSLVAHLKQFVYAFHDTVLKRVVTEARHGNYTPAMALASYIPIMMASDFLKGMIIGGGSQPAYKDSWDFGDYFGAAMQRAGLFSVSQFGLDVVKDIRRGGTGAGPLVGPQLEQIGDALRMMGGRDSVGNFVSDALPAAVLAKAVGRLGESKGDPNFSD